MDDDDLAKLLITQIGDLDDAARRIEAISERVGTAMDRLLKDWASASGWAADDRAWVADSEFTFGHPSWRLDDGWIARLSLWYEPGDDGTNHSDRDYFWLTRLCGAGRGKAGFRFYFDELGRNDIKRFFKTRADALADTLFIADSEPSFFLPVRLSKDKLAESVENDRIDEGLSELRDALDYVKSIYPRLQSILDEIRTTAGKA